MVLVLVPGGKIPVETPFEGGNESLRPFLIGKHEVTQRQWLTVMGQNPAQFRPGGSGEDELPPELKRDHQWLELPVERVSWDDCRAFCRVTGLALPTEAQWEYACRAGTTTEYHSGDTQRELRQVAWYKENSDKRTHRVGRKGASAFGLQTCRSLHHA